MQFYCCGWLVPLWHYRHSAACAGSGHQRRQIHEYARKRNNPARSASRLWRPSMERIDARSTSCVKAAGEQLGRPERRTQTQMDFTQREFSTVTAD